MDRYIDESTGPALDTMRLAHAAFLRDGTPLVYLHRPLDPHEPTRGHPPFAALVDLEWLETVLERAGISHDGELPHDHLEGDEGESERLRRRLERDDGDEDSPEEV